MRVCVRISGKISINIINISINIGDISVKYRRYFQNKNQIAILTPKNSINTPKIIQFIYKLIYTYQSSI